MTSYERRVKKLHDHVVKNEKAADKKSDGPTVKELQALLTEKGIEFSPKANKAALMELLSKSEEEDPNDVKENNPDA